jgi:alpha-tubulin suppressor-like RCC1 family protein
MATSIGYGQTLAFSILSGGSGSVAGTFAWTTPSTLPNAGTVIQDVTFTPSDTANYNTATASVSVTVNAALISSGFSHTLYLGAGATTVTAWGLNTDGRLGVGDMNSPVNWAKAVQGIPVGATVDGLAAGGTHSLILAGGEVYAAGSDRFGQLGQGAVNGANKTSFTPVAIPSSTPVAVAAGGNHSLIVTADGEVFACGDNTYGQLAQPATTLSSGSLVEVVFPGLSTKIVSVVAGADHNLAVDEGGGVWVWGRNDSGQLGKNTRTSADRTPVRILLSGAKSLAAGYAHSLILKQDGSVLGFGRNTLGQTGQSSGTSYAKLPIPIPGLSGIRLISAGTDSSFAIDGAGQLRSWGYNAYGELLLGYASPSSSPAVYGPTPSPIATNVFNVSGGGYSSLAVGAQGVIFGGRNDVGQAGNGPDPDQVVGDYYYEAGSLTLSNLTMDLAGTTETLYDQIFVGNGAATLNGIVNLMFVGTYTGPVYGSTQTFDLIWAKNGIVFGAGYQLAFNQAGYLVDSAVADKIVEGVSGKVLQATVRAVVTVADLAKAVDLAKPNLDGVESVSYGVESNEAMGIRQLSVSPSPAVDMVEMIYSYKRPTGGVMGGAEYFVNGVTYRVEYTASLQSGLVDWNPAVVTGTTITPLGGGYERATLRISASGSAGFLRLTTEIPPAAGIGAGVGSAVTL